jgi:hypothetical protein
MPWWGRKSTSRPSIWIIVLPNVLWWQIAIRTTGGSLLGKLQQWNDTGLGESTEEWCFGSLSHGLRCISQLLWRAASPWYQSDGRSRLNYFHGWTCCQPDLDLLDTWNEFKEWSRCIICCPDQKDGRVRCYWTMDEWYFAESKRVIIDWLGEKRWMIMYQKE